MSDSRAFRGFLVCLTVASLLQIAYSKLLWHSGNSSNAGCRGSAFRCVSNGECINCYKECDGKEDCSDGSDELNCGGSTEGCEHPRFLCANKRCISCGYLCDGNNDCRDGSDELNCVSRNPLLPIRLINTGVPSASQIAEQKLTAWFLGRKKTETGADKWGDQLHRTAVALFLSHKEYFSPGNKMGEELTYELTIRLLSHLSLGGNKTLPTSELALYINAMKVACLNPRDFYGHNLISELRSRVNNAKYSNPFEILVLCTAGDVMRKEDVEKTMRAHDSQHRPFWIDNQAVSTMALACLFKQPGLHVDERKIQNMVLELKKRQFRNGTVDNPRSTALVLQAIVATNSTEENFNRSAALRTITQSQKRDGSYGSLVDSYYVLPVFSNRSLTDVSSSHCNRSAPSAEEITASLMKGDDTAIPVYYSIWVKNNVLGRNWKLMIMVPANNTLYDVIETVNRLDINLNVEYNIFESKPYVSRLSGLQDDLEIGMYWFMYTKSHGSKDEPELREQSPVDLRVEANQELILWYRAAQWHEA